MPVGKGWSWNQALIEFGALHCTAQRPACIVCPLRADGQAFGSSVHWVLAAIIPSMMPLLIKTLGITSVFAFFAFMMVLQLLFVWRMMPETKGRALEELEKSLVTTPR